MKRNRLYQHNSIFFYILFFVIGVLVGFRTVPDLVGVLYLILAGICIYFALNNNYIQLIALFPFLIYTEGFLRVFVSFIPYLFMPYLYIGCFLLLFLQGNTVWKLHSSAFLFLIFYFVVELVSSTRAFDPIYARGLVINSLAIVLMVTWGSFNVLDSIAVNKILNNIKYAGIYMCGIVIARYLMGGVEFSVRSGSEATNGLAPVQVSGYLGFVCAVFFFSIMDEKERNRIVLNIFLLGVSSIVMMLSFSRGGVYFLGVIMGLYFIFNSQRIKSYFLFLILIPVGLFVYSYVVDTTGGKIVERYEQEGSSGRDELVEAGWSIFWEEPIAGVGTGNYNKEIIKRGFYSSESGAHNEFIRVASEDGLLGIITYWGFFVSQFVLILKRKKTQRDFGIYFLVFFCLILIHNGLKISLQPLLLLLAVATPSLKMVKIKRNAPAPPKLSAGPA